jgi:hypothetical protein
MIKGILILLTPLIGWTGIVLFLILDKGNDKDNNK